MKMDLCMLVTHESNYMLHWVGIYGVDGGVKVWLKWGTAYQKRDQVGEPLPKDLRRKPTIR